MELSHRVLVLDASRRASLAVIRSLGKRGIPVTAAKSRFMSPGNLSIYARNAISYPPPESGKSAFLKFLLDHVRTHAYELMFPIHDFSLLPVSEARGRFTPFLKLLLPPEEALAIATDKVATLSIATELGIPTPETHTVDDLAELKSLTARISYPALVKPRTQVRWNGDTAALTLVGRGNYANSPDELERVYLRVHSRSPFPIVQRVVPGAGAGVAAIFSSGEPRVLFSYRRVREYPITGGPSTVRESTDDPVTKEYAEMILRALKWHGVAMVEFKIGSEGPCLLEVNGRFWGSLCLPIFSGVDFPYLLYRLATEGDIDPVLAYKVGIRARWLIPGDILWLASTFKEGTGSRYRVLKEFLTVTGMHYDYESSLDPLPALGAIIMSFSDELDVLRKRRSVSGEYLQPQAR